MFEGQANFSKTHREQLFCMNKNYSIVLYLLKMNKQHSTSWELETENFRNAQKMTAFHVFCTARKSSGTKFTFLPFYAKSRAAKWKIIRLNDKWSFVYFMLVLLDQYNLFGNSSCQTTRLLQVLCVEEVKRSLRLGLIRLEQKGWM